MRSTIMTLAFSLLLPVAAQAKDNGAWRASHPRRAEVNDRLANQNARIHEGVKDGKLTRGQAAQLHAEDHAIRQEERTMAATNGGHVTKAEKKSLNQQENQVSKQIYEEKH